MSNSSNLPAPYQGVQESVPKAAIKSPYCENLVNFNTNRAGISLRNGDSKYKLLSMAAAGSSPLQLFNYGNTNLFALAHNLTTNKIDIYDVDTQAIVYSSVATAGSSLFVGLYFNKYLFFFCPLAPYAPGFYYNGSIYGAIGYTGSGFLPVGGNTFNHRAYIIQYQDASYWYSELEAISGALTKVDLNSIVKEKCELSIIASITLADTVEAVTLQAFVFSNGEVLFYGGSYPDSNSWRIIGEAKIGQPLWHNAVVSYQGDKLVLCDTGVVSLRDLFLTGSEAAASLTVNSNIQDTWTRLVQAMRAQVSMPNGPINGNIKGVWDQKTNRIVISFPFYLDSTGTLQVGSFYFVFYSILKSWFFHRSYGLTAGLSAFIFDIAAYKNKVLLLIPGTTKIMIAEKEGAFGFMDRNPEDSGDVAYTYEMLSAPIPFPKTAVYDSEGIEPIMESDLYSETNWNFVSDFGKQTSNNQNISDTMATTVSKPLVNAGMENSTYVQVKMSGTTVAGKTIGLDLYSYNVWYEAGEIASR